jgi:CubicO group peptidase (beta-lactamase class C family)
MRAQALNVHGGTGPIGATFNYHNGYPLLEGIILERTTHKTASAYLEEKIWKPLGMEYPASWSLDSQESGFEQMGGGINARSIDFAKFGRLFLNDGNWNGKQLLPAGWVKEATSPDPADNRPFKTNPEWKDMGGYYKYHWWGMHNQDGTYDYAALGHYGQIIYISPTNKAIAVRNGASGNPLEWATIARSVIQSLK